MAMNPTRFYYQLENSREKVIADVKEMLLTIVDFTAIDEQIDAREEELEEISTLVRAEIQNNARQANMQDSFDAKLERLRERYDATEAALADLRQQKVERLNRQKRIALFLREIEREEPIKMWDDRLWVTTLDHAVSYPDGRLEFRFYNGQSITITDEKKR